MLHRAWATLLAGWEVRHVSYGRKELDLSRPEMIEGRMPEGTRLVINCAAWTDVDGAEKDEAGATLINGTSVGELARVCRQRGAMLVHYSTDYVFNGQGKRPYPVDAPIAPINAYGRSKAVGEQLIRASGCRHLLIRTSWVYAPWGKNFVRTIVGFLRQNRPLRIVDDQVGRPSSAEQLALNTAKLIEVDAEGTLHLADSGECTWHTFAREIARHINPGAQVDACSSAQLSRPAPRPGYSVLDLTLAERLIGAPLAWQEALADVLRRLE